MSDAAPTNAFAVLALDWSRGILEAIQLNTCILLPAVPTFAMYALGLRLEATWICLASMTAIPLLPLAWGRLYWHTVGWVVRLGYPSSIDSEGHSSRRVHLGVKPLGGRQWYRQGLRAGAHFAAFAAV
jgi:hypothetical protein